MEETPIGPYEELGKNKIIGLSSVVDDMDGNLTAVTSEGFIYSLTGQNCIKKSETGGQAFSVLCDSSNTLFITDLAQQAIYSYSEEESLQDLFTTYEGKPFLGPNSLAFHDSSNSLYFTDSGPLGETSLLNPRGSVYVADIDQGTIKPVISKVLAHPSGIGITSDGKTIYVAETFKNRLLKVIISPSGAFHTSLFYQFSGRLGPTAVCVSDSNLIYVANFEFASAGEKGKVSVLNSNGVLVKIFSAPISEITSLSFSKVKSNILYVSGSGKAFKVTVPGE